MPRPERSFSQQLDDVDRQLARIQSTMEILLAVRIVEDGHAANMRDALEIARDLELLKALYPEAVDG